MASVAHQFGWIWSVWLWIGLGIAFRFANTFWDEPPRAPLHLADIALYAIMIFCLLVSRGQGLLVALPKALAPWAFIGLSWVFGMIYELSLTVDGTGIGGIHPDTRSSFILAQGDYILIAIATWAAVRFFHLDFRDAFFFAGGKSLSEALVFTGVLVATLVTAQAILAPLLLAYYTLAYASFVALPLLILDPKSLWADQAPTQKPSMLRLWLMGVVCAFVVRLVWGFGWSPLATWLFSLPPNPV